MSDAKLKYITGNSEGTASKCRVFCTFHPENKAIADKVMSDMVSVCDCNVFYYENGEGPSSGEELVGDLGDMALFVFIVSSEYLFTPSFARNTAYDFAVSHMIPILPIMIENALEEPFNKSMGELQYILLNTECYDATSVPYIEKLQNHLYRITTQKQDSERLRAAFDASVFLSYRKKDRRFARELMKLIHDDEACRGISIWYDEFLIPGENFNEGIRTELENSGAFILVITPHTVEKNNYITLTEYPLAMSMGKTVIPFEMSPTDRNELKEAYPGISEPFSAADSDSVKNAIKALVGQLGAKPLESYDEKAYLMGLAYLKGIFVERNTDIGVKMIASAAENGVEEAMEALVSMYKSGEGVALSLKAAEAWQKKIISAREAKYSDSKSAETARLLAEAYLELCRIYEQGSQAIDAIEAYDIIIEICLDEELKDEPFAREMLLTSYEMAAVHSIKIGEYFRASYEYIDRAIKMRQSDYDKSNDLISLLKLIELYTLSADCYEGCQNIPQLKTAVLQIKKLIPNFGDISNIEDIRYDVLKKFLICNNRLGHLYISVDKRREAHECIENSIFLAEKLIQISNTYDSKRQLVLALINKGDHYICEELGSRLEDAEEAYKKAFEKASGIISDGDTTTELRLDIARITQKRAYVKRELGMLDEAVTLYNEAAESLKELHSLIDTLPVKIELSDSLREASAVYSLIKDTAACERLLKESIAFAYKAIERSELAVYKKGCAKSLAMLADLYKKQWETDEAFKCRKEQCGLLREVMNGTKRVGDMKAFAYALKELLSSAKLAGEFEEGKAYAEELASLVEKYKMFF